MRLPYDLLKDTYVAPKVFLCETDKAQICGLESIGLKGTFKFNSYSEISFETPRTLLDIHMGEYYANPFYDKIEALRLIHLPGFGYFEIQTPTINSDGIKESKSITAFSLEYALSQKYISNFIINSPDINGNIGGGDPAILSQLYDDYVAGDYTFEEYNELVNTITKNDPLVQLYDKENPSHSLLHLALQKAYGWSIGHVDASLATQTRSFNIERSSIYDFLMNDVAQTFKCYFTFDTVNNIINVYSETSSVKFNGDGSTTTFVVIPAFLELSSVTINGYRTLDYLYDATTGVIQFSEPPEIGSIIEVNDGAQAEYQTDIFISFENLASEMECSYEADNIKTCLKVTGADDLDIRDVNLGLDYIMDLSYFNTPDWMGQELYEAYNKYIRLVNEKTSVYTECLKEYNDLWAQYSELYNRTTSYIVEDENEIPKIHLTKLKLDNFKQMLQQYYCDKNIDGTFAGSQIKIVDQIKDDFKFLDNTITEYLDFLQRKSNPSEDDIKEVEEKTYEILKLIWNEFGISMLNIYVTSYTNVQQTHLESGWGTQINGFAHKDEDGLCDEYCFYWANYLMLSSCQAALNERTAEADNKQKEINDISEMMTEISNEILMEKHFTEGQLVRLNAFIREDEYSDDNFIISESDTTENVFKAKKELLQCGKVELAKLCAPVLSFTAKLANIYALEEFKPIVDQFQLGNMVNISLRPGYLKKTRLMEVDINFEDFSDFSCTFGELIAIKSQADIHADLLKQAVSAGKSVASNSSYWDKGADLATKTDIKIQNGLLDANIRLKAIDNNQGVVIDKNGIHLQEFDESGTAGPRQGRIVNNMICYTDDNWKTVKSVFGEYKIGKDTYWGLLAEGVIAGYIEGSTIVASEIKAGDTGDGSGNYYFHVTPEGEITATKGNIAGWTIDENSIRHGALGKEDSMWLCRNGSKTEAAIGGSASTNGWSVGVGSNFGVTKDGKLYSTAGEIAGWTISPTAFKKELRINSTDYQISMQAPNGNNTVNAFVVESKAYNESKWTTQFSVNYEGQLTAKNATIEGRIVATSGQIGDCVIEEGILKISTAKLGDVSASQIRGGSLDFSQIEVKNLSADYITTGILDCSKVTVTNLNAGIISTGSLDGSKISVTNLSANNITSGTLDCSKVVVANLSANKITTGTLDASKVSVTNLNADNITSGTINGNSVSVTNLNAGNITAGTLSVDRIPSLSADKITVGTLNADRIPNISASKITTGTLSADRLSSSVITTGNFSSKSLSTGSLTIKTGCVIGATTYNADIDNRSGYVFISADGPIRYGTTIHELVRSATASSSNRDIKHDIHDFDDRYDTFFDKLNPQLFKYNFEPNEGYTMGYIWQEAEEALGASNLTRNDVGAIYESEAVNGGLGLRKTDFIALNTWQIQKLKSTVASLQEEIELLKQQINS